jgi:hypothetical protein
MKFPHTSWTPGGRSLRLQARGRSTMLKFMTAEFKSEFSLAPDKLPPLLRRGARRWNPDGVHDLWGNHT